MYDDYPHYPSSSSSYAPSPLALSLKHSQPALSAAHRADAGEAHGHDFGLLPRLQSRFSSSSSEYDPSDDEEEEVYGRAFGRRSPDFFRSTATSSAKWWGEEPSPSTPSHPAPRSPANKLRRHRSLPAEDLYAADVEDESPRPTSPAPTCGDALRRQWYTVMLRVRVAAFRARKRITLKHPHPSTPTLQR